MEALDTSLEGPLLEECLRVAVEQAGNLRGKLERAATQVEELEKHRQVRWRRGWVCGWAGGWSVVLFESGPGACGISDDVSACLGFEGRRAPGPRQTNVRSSVGILAIIAATVVVVFVFVVEDDGVVVVAVVVVVVVVVVLVVLFMLLLLTMMMMMMLLLLLLL